MTTPHTILKKYWGFDNFRPVQEDIINAVLANKDVLAILPTGGGKSICFQVPAMMKDGICLVISPLIALMKDQVESLTAKGIPALSVYSGMNFTEIKKTLQNIAYGNYKFLYVSPERLETKLFTEYLPLLNINLLAVDEAHCISQWGYDFRPPYLRIANIREFLPAIPVLALTASATTNVQDDICKKLLFEHGHLRFKKSFERPNLSYSVFNVPSKHNKLLTILTNVPGTGIVYCKSRRHTKEIADFLRMNKINADYYHAGLSNDERNRKQENWLQNKIRIIVCTNAFGMGIDKPDVRVVVHFDIPDCLENYYQEAGRAGRDEKKSYAVLLYHNADLTDLSKQVEIKFPSPEKIKETYTALMNYLQVAASAGEGVSIDFNIAAFSERFKLDIVIASNCIKMLEQENVLTYNETFFKPSSVVFIVTKQELNDYESMHPEHSAVIKSLLRLYGGIFDFPATISEKKIATFSVLTDEEVKMQLLQLHQQKIIDYIPITEKPQITLLQNRMYNDSYQVNTANYTQRKNEFRKRLKGMLDYVNNSNNCRSQALAKYFGDSNVPTCGICDCCLSKTNNHITKAEFENIQQQIKLLVKDNGLPVEDLLHQLKGFKKEKIWQVIDFLQAENLISVSAAGWLFTQNK